jgi:formylglycine-generating enzyme required for sulfatase activity
MSQESTKVCPVCGREFGPKHKFCLSHGVPLVAKSGAEARRAPAPPARRCEHCGAEAKAGWKFCIKCRTELPSLPSPIPAAGSRDEALEHDGGARLPGALAGVESASTVPEGRELIEVVPTPAPSPDGGGLSAGAANQAIRRANGTTAEALSAETKEDVIPTVPQDLGRPAAPPGLEAASPANPEVAGPLGSAGAVTSDVTPLPGGAPSEGRSFLTWKVGLIAGACLVFVLLAAGVAVLYALISGRSEAESRAQNSRPAAAPASPTAIVTPAVATESAGQSPPEGMIYVPGGTFLMGRDNGDEYERPAHSVTVKPFYVDEHEVTCEQYSEFVKATGQPPPATWVGSSYPPGHGRRPVTGVSWVAANAYALWAGKRLPTEEEWEFAARGTDGRIYPWGGEWQAGLANADTSSRQGMADVGEFKGASTFGALDMVGNAWEWTASPLQAYPGGRLPKQEAGDLRVIRGGSWQSDRSTATTTYRFGWAPERAKDYNKTSFRCVKDVAADKR